MSDNSFGFTLELHFQDGYVKVFHAEDDTVDGAYALQDIYESNGELATDKEVHGNVVKTCGVSNVISISRDGVELT
jgi:hypothetical protein